MSEVRLPPLFLSPDAYASAIRIFEAVKSEDKSYVDNAALHALVHLGWHAWSDYDETYLALYTLALLRRGEPVSLNQTWTLARKLPRHLNPLGNMSREFPRFEELEFLLDIGLIGRDSPYKLLDERGVAQLINFRHSLEGFFPFEIRPSALGIDVRRDRSDVGTWDDAPHGKVAMTFEVALPRLPALGLEEGRSESAFLSSFFTGDTWKAVRTRFGVADVEVDGRTQSL